LAHPLRAQILERLEDHTASPTELADELAAPLGNVSYHVRILADAGLIELARTTRRRGATEHHYRTAAQATTAQRPAPQPEPAEPGPTGEAADDLGEAEVPIGETEVGETVEEIAETGEEIHGRVRATGDDATARAHITRTPLVLDDLAWDQLLGAVEQLHDLALRLQLESAPRLRRVQHADQREANLVLMLFESSDPAATRVVRGGVGERRRSTGWPR
jgi:DNA-binding transcriptional ArsR family regulator